MAEIWCKEPTTHIDVWGCDWTCEEFFDFFLDYCKYKELLKEAFGIWWLVHNAPGSEIEPCYSNYVCQQIIDYSIKYGMESETLHLKEYGLDKFKLIEETQELYRGKGLSYFNDKIAYGVYPNPKDEDGRFIPLIKSKDGNVIHWPKHDDRFLTCEEIRELGI